MTELDAFIDLAVRRLLQVVEEETRRLEAKAATELQEFNLRKSQGLYELSRALHRLAGRPLSPSTLEGMRSLRIALRDNHAALHIHLQAVREIADVVATAIREAESDGTYGPPFKRIGANTC